MKATAFRLLNSNDHTMIFRHLTKFEADRAQGWAIAIDVIRAFSTAAYAFSCGAERILCTDSSECAVRLKAGIPGSLAMGEESDGHDINTFDFNNSPTLLVRHDLSGKTLIQRTTSGTVGLVGARSAKGLLACGLVNAGATIRFLQKVRPEEVDFIETGVYPNGRGDDDIACADYIESVLKGQPISKESVLDRVLHAKEIMFFQNGDEEHFPVNDLKMVTNFDCFDFVMQGKRIAPDCVELRKVQ